MPGLRVTDDFRNRHLQNDEAFRRNRQRQDPGEDRRMHRPVNNHTPQNSVMESSQYTDMLRRGSYNEVSRDDDNIVYESNRPVRFWEEQPRVPGERTGNTRITNQGSSRVRFSARPDNPDQINHFVGFVPERERQRDMDTERRQRIGSDRETERERQEENSNRRDRAGRERREQITGFFKHWGSC